MSLSTRQTNTPPAQQVLTACAILKSGIVHGITEVVGLSGGAWGALKLANPENGIGACEEVERVLKLSEKGGDGWVRFKNFKIGCKQASYNDMIAGTILSCHDAWTKDIREGIFENRKSLKFVGNDFGDHVKTTIVVNQCRFEDEIHRPARKNDVTQAALRPETDNEDDDEDNEGNFGGFSVHTGACALSASGVSCKSFVGGDTSKEMTNMNVGGCEIYTDVNARGHALGEGKSDDVFDWISFSSAAYGEAKRHLHLKPDAITWLKDLVASPGHNKNTPVVKCKTTTTDGTENEITSNYCDAGGRCNYPLSYLATRTKSELPDKIVAFDFSLQIHADGSSSLNAEFSKCKSYWANRLGWAIPDDDGKSDLREKETDWGVLFEIEILGKKIEVSLVIMNNLRTASLFKHVLKSGAKYGLSKKFEVVKPFSDDFINYFGQDKENLAKIFKETYTPWLLTHLKDQRQGPFSALGSQFGIKIRRMNANVDG